MPRPRKPGQISPENQKQKIYKSVVKFKDPSGWTYVREVSSVYDPRIQNMRTIKTKSLGKLPPGETDIKNMIPVGKRGRKKKAEILHDKTRNFLKPLDKIKDERNPHRIVYPLKAVILVAIVAAVFKLTGNGEIAQFWKACRPTFEKYYPNFPKEDISHDTVRNLTAMLGRQGHATLIEDYAKKLVQKLDRRIINVDGQAVRASRNEEDRWPYLLNVCDADNEIILTHELIDAKSNEIKYAAEVISRLDIEGAIVTCDALNTQRKFAETICSKGADYLFALKKNQDTLYDHVESLFNLRKDFKSAETKIEQTAGRIESRDLKALPASLLIPQLSEKWIGLEEGCIVQAITRSVNKKTGVAREPKIRYYITSLRYDTQYISEVLMRAVRQHWRIEQLHWNLDVILNQDRLQCRNGEYLAGRIALNKIGMNFLSRIQAMIETEDGITLSKKEIQSMLRDPEAMLETLFSIAA